MIKKLGFAAVLLVGAVVFLNTTYAHLGWKKARTFFDKQISPETKLELIKEQVANLDQQGKQYVSDVAKETVVVRKMKREIAESETDQKVKLEKVLTMKKDLEAGETFIVYGGEKFSRERIERKFNNDWESYKRSQDTLRHRKDELDAHERALIAAEERLKEFQGKREEMQTEVAKLETELKNVQLAKSRCNFNFDDGKLGEVKKQMSELKDYIEQQKVESEMANKYTTDAIPVGEKAPTATDTMKEVSDYVTQQGGQKVEKTAEAPKAADTKDVK